MRVLFFNEGNLGTFIMGQGQLEASLRAHGAGPGELDARFAGLTPIGRLGQASIEWAPGPVARRDLHLPTLRWHVVQSSRARRALKQELARFAPDVLHVHSHSIALRLGAVMRRVPTALSVDTTITDWSLMPAWRPTARLRVAELAPVRAVERRRFDDAAVVLAWTAWARRRVLALAPRAHVVEHHPGVDLARLRPAEREPRELPRVLFVGGRFAEKGGEDLLAALADDLGRTVELDVVTPAEVAPRPGLRVHRLGPDDPELLRLRQQADVFCLPSHGDAAPWAILEAMACGTPAIGSDVGGIPDLLGGGDAGVVVAPGDRPALRGALTALLEDAPRREALGAAARARCAARYDVAVQAPLLLDHLRTAATARAGGVAA